MGKLIEEGASLINTKNIANIRKQIKLKKGADFLYSIFRLVFLISVGFIIIYPLFYMLVSSVKSNDEILYSTRIWIPEGFSVLNNYKIATICLDYAKSLWSTFLNELIPAMIQVVSCSVVAYGFARFEFKFKNAMMFLLIVTILVPDMILLIPRMVNYSNVDFLGILGIVNKITGVDLRINILNSVWAFWLPSLLAVGLKSGILIYIYIQFFKGLPYELEEAAWVDGAGPIRTFVSIALPLSGEVIVTVTIFSLVWHWNDTTLSQMYISSDYPLAVLLERIDIQLFTKQGLLMGVKNPESISYVMASCMLFVLPMLLVYMVLQRRFIESIDRIGITG